VGNVGGRDKCVYGAQQVGDAPVDLRRVEFADGVIEPEDQPVQVRLHALNVKAGQVFEELLDPGWLRGDFGIDLLQLVEDRSWCLGIESSVNVEQARDQALCLERGTKAC